VKYKLKDICTKITDGSHNPPAGIQKSQYLMLSSKNISDDCITFDNPRYLTKEDFIVENKRTSIQTGDLLLTIVGTVGRVAVISNNDNNICLQRSVAVLKPQHEMVNDRYLMYHLQHIRPALESEAKGVAQKGIYLKQVENIEVLIPSTTTQSEIVIKLDNITDLINKRKVQLSKLDVLVKARFVELFGGKYKTVKLGDVVKTTSGGTPSKAHPEYYENGTIPWLTSGEVNAGVITSVKNCITDLGMKNSSAKMVPANSVVVAMYGATAGVTGLIRIDTTTNQAVCSILPSERFIPEYLYYAVASKKDWMISQCQGGGQPNISQGIIKNMDVIDAPIEEQIRFATFVEQTDKSKLKVQKSLEKLELLKKSLMQKYFG